MGGFLSSFSHYPQHGYWSSANNSPYQHHQGHVYRYSANNTTYHHQASDDKNRNDNLNFYKNKIKSKPFPGYSIEDMLKWKGNYHTLEINHSYIQWLFPNFDTRGLNSSAQPLQQHEAMEIAQTPELRDRFVRAYKMMLHFYGMELKSTKTGEIQRCEENWRDRFRHLNTSKHNHFRITRILHSLAAFGFHKYQEPLIMFVMENETVLPCLQGGTLAYWWNTILSEDRGLQDLNDEFSESGEVAESGFDKENCKNNKSNHAEYESPHQQLSNKAESCHNEGDIPVKLQDEQTSATSISKNDNFGSEKADTINQPNTQAGDVQIKAEEELVVGGSDKSSVEIDLSHKDKSSEEDDEAKMEAIDEDKSSEEDDEAKMEAIDEDKSSEMDDEAKMEAIDVSDQANCSQEQQKLIQQHNQEQQQLQPIQQQQHNQEQQQWQPIQQQHNQEQQQWQPIQQQHNQEQQLLQPIQQQHNQEQQQLQPIQQQQHNQEQQQLQPIQQQQHNQEQQQLQPIQQQHSQQLNAQQWLNDRQPSSNNFQMDPQTKETGCTAALSDDM